MISWSMENSIPALVCWSEWKGLGSPETRWRRNRGAGEISWWWLKYCGQSFTLVWDIVVAQGHSGAGNRLHVPPTKMAWCAHLSQRHVCHFPRCVTSSLAGI